MAGSATPGNRSSAGRDPFPTQRFGALLRRMPAYARLGWLIGRDPSLGTSRRAALVGAMAYLASPIDLVPGFIPVVGQLDDAAVALLGLRFALDGLPASRRAAHLSATGLSAADLDDDLKTIQLGAAWITRQGLRMAEATIRGLVRVGTAGGQAAVANGRAALEAWHGRGHRQP
ncbi:MAG TPA: YkvA family protein [Candidatus Limnocylindria bacterium]